MQTTLRADVLVIGFGKGGKAAAAALGELGRRVVLVERSAQMYGGTCPNVGCVPTKALVHKAGKRRPSDPPQAFYERAVAEVQEIRAFMRDGNFAALDGAPTITVVTGAARFVDPHTVDVDVDGDRISISAETILINTGSEPVVPDALLASPRTLTSAELIARPELPKRLAIAGAGYLGIEFAAIYRRFGSQVTLLEQSSRILEHEDDDVAGEVERILRDEGVEILTGAHVAAIRDEASHSTVVFADGGIRQELEADAILAATGRVPATAELGLDAAGVATTPAGAVVVDEHLRTSRAHIFALGDVTGGPQFTYLSLDDSRIVLDQLVGEGRRSTRDRVAIPRTLFITPPLATVGLTENEARGAGRRIKIARQHVADIIAMPRAYAVEETRGLMKFVLDADTDEILGAALLSIDAQELINVVALAMRHGLKAADLRDAIYTHPSSTEAFNDVLGTIVREPVAA